MFPELYELLLHEINEAKIQFISFVEDILNGNYTCWKYLCCSMGHSPSVYAEVACHKQNTGIPMLVSIYFIATFVEMYI